MIYKPKSQLVAVYGANPLLDSARRSIAKTFSYELEPLGIRVMSVVSGPIAAPDMPAEIILDERHVFVIGDLCPRVLPKQPFRNICSKKADPDTLRIFSEWYSIYSLNCHRIIWISTCQIRNFVLVAVN